MISRIFRTFGIGLLVLFLIAQPISAPPVFANRLAQADQFIVQDGSNLRLNGEIFRFAGSNNYYLMYKSPFMVDDVLTAAAANHFTVLRVWGSLEIGNQDGMNSINGKAEGVYFQYFDPVGHAPAFNDGDDGLKHLDYVVYKAGQLGLRLVIPLVNNWDDFGGIDQYVSWHNGQYHDDFFSDPTIRQWFKNWITHLLNHTNAYTGVQYKNDPTIMAWELANEPRCEGSGSYPGSGNCTTQTLITWAELMSKAIKEIDGNHLVSVGDEGFYCIPGAQDWTENCSLGVDTVAFAQIPDVDIMSFHLYPDHWGKDPGWGVGWITRHISDAQAIQKPVMLGEFGLLDKDSRNPVYKQWTDTVFANGGNGALYWLLSGKQDDGSLYPDYDGFTVYCPSPVCAALGNFAQRMTANNHQVFLPMMIHTVPLLFSFENDTEGWQAGGGTSISLSTDWSTKGTHSLVVNSAGSWLSHTFSTPMYMTGKTRLTYDLKTLRKGTSTAIALKLGDSWTWCESPFGFAQPNTIRTVEIDLLSLKCGITDLSKVREIDLYISPGTFYVDNIVVQ